MAGMLTRKVDLREDHSTSILEFSNQSLRRKVSFAVEFFDSFHDFVQAWNDQGNTAKSGNYLIPVPNNGGS
jgi:hypothetical protein